MSAFLDLLDALVIFMEQNNFGVNRMEPCGNQVLRIGDLGLPSSMLKSDELQFIEVEFCRLILGYFLYS